MVRNPLVIGRSDSCDVLLESRSVSRRHCELKLKRHGLTIKDLESRNGTMVNGKAIEPNIRLLLSVGDSVQIGKFTLQVEDVSENVNEPAQVTSKDRNPEQEDLLASLEEFIRDRTVNDSRIAIEKSPDAEQASSNTTVLWTPTKAASDPQETVSDLRNEETRLPEDSSTSGASSTTSDKVTVTTDGDKLVDEAELRRLDLRKRLDGMKAKDSKEAANRALKKLFGG